MARLYKDENGMYYRFAGDVEAKGLTEVPTASTEPSQKPSVEDGKPTSRSKRGKGKAKVSTDTAPQKGE